MDLFDKRLRVNVTAFRADTKDFQGGSAFITNLAGGAQQLSFVTRNVGYLDFQAAKDDAARCTAARRMRLAADRGNYSGQLTYASYLIEGKLAACPDRATPTEGAAYVTAARPAVQGFFETRFADHLGTQFATIEKSRKPARRRQ